jgi:hypothetical protein
LELKDLKMKGVEKAPRKIVFRVFALVTIFSKILKEL